MKLVHHPPVELERLARIIDAAGAMSVVNAATDAEALAHMPDADALFGKITPPLLAAAHRLRWVQTPTASLEHYLFPELTAHPCVLTNMRGLFSDVIADQVFGYILCFARNLHRYILQQADGRWAPIGGEKDRVSFATGPGVVNAIDRAHIHLADCTLGVVGLGSIGAEVARRALAFGMRVLAVDPVQPEAPAGVESLWRPERLPELLGESDFVVIAAPHTPETEKLFRRPQFRQMKPTAYVINVGRGAIVDLGDLTEALKAGGLAGAALDVFETEPLPADHPLWRMGDRVILTPHVAGYSPRIAERHFALLLDNIGRFMRGEPLRNVVDKARWF
ncbi:MAG TPA: D-2-hydroxyacid dehydrogenase [Planctomycetales bacterium]|jgi:phosphoglycerate dehydrogenase-like enzyme|nr:D-2-hydroxyacid dehydrogenase [Planctomycetales bacterium]